MTAPAWTTRPTVGRLDTVRTLRCTLIRRLSEMGAETSNDRPTLTDELVTHPLQPHATRPRRARGLRDGAPA